MDVVNNRRATFKNIKCNEWQLFRAVRLFLLVSMPLISRQNFSTLKMNMSL